MALRQSSLLYPPLGLLSLLLFHRITTIAAARATILPSRPPPSGGTQAFREAPAFRNGYTCTQNYDNHIHIVMPLDANYIRGTIAAVLSILQHSACPEHISFHFLSLHFHPKLFSTIKSTFPYLNFKRYHFDSNRVRGKISKSVRQALDQPLNYARIYLSDVLPVDVERVIYLDSDIIVVDDIAKLWRVDLGDNVVAAPEYCHANFTNYFTDAFWLDSSLAKKFERKERPCYFNTGVMVVDVYRWRKGGYTQKVEEWMILQKQKRIYDLGSLPPILLVFAGNIKGVDHRWNQHGLGGDNFEGNCRGLHPGPVSLLHWSGKGKPWLRVDVGKPCTVDHLWTPYDLHRSLRVALEGWEWEKFRGDRS